APQHAVMEAYEVERDFPIIGRRLMLLNAREVFNQRNSRNLILLTFEDATDRRAARPTLTKLIAPSSFLIRDLTCPASILLGSAEAAPRPLWLAATSASPA